jgi:beta-lactamase class A
MAFAVTIDLPAAAHLERPAVVEPAPREASFGRVAGRVGPGTARVVVLVDGAERAGVEPQDGRFAAQVSLPLHTKVRIQVAAEDAAGNRAVTIVAPVLGLPDVEPAPAEDGELDEELARRVDRLVDDFAGVSGVYVQDLASGRGAAWNAKARFPAASTVKTAIAIEVLRILAERPPPDSEVDLLLNAMLVDSDNDAANALLTWIGGSETAGAAQVTETLGALSLEDSRLYGGFLTAASGEPIPLQVEESPSFVGKYTSAWDLAQLYRWLHLGARDEGPLLRLQGSFTSSDARAILWILAHSSDHGKLDRYVRGPAQVPHKAGWVSDARHDAGLVYTPDGALVVSVMTWVPGGAAQPSDVLAGRVTQAALAQRRREGAVVGPAADEPALGL